MPQYARPDSDIATGNWTTAALWSKLDETTPGDADYILHDSTALSVCRLGLSNASDPAMHTGHIVRHRAKASSISSPVSAYSCALYQGTTLIASWDRRLSLTDAFQTFAETLSEAQAEAITDYTALELRLTGDKSTTYPLVSWAEMEIPLAITLAETLQIVDALKFLASKAQAEGIFLADVINMLVSPSYSEAVTITDACEALMVMVSEQAEAVGLGDFIELLYGKSFAEGLTVADAVMFFASKLQAETLALADVLNFLANVAGDETLTVADAVSNLILTSQAENLNISDIISSYIFIPNKPLSKYGTRILIDMLLDSGTKYFSTEDMHVEE